MIRARRLPLPLLALVLLAPACMVIVGGRSTPSVDHFADHDEHGPQCAAIDVASALTFSDDRADALKRIAARPELSEHEQLFVIDAAIDGGGFSSDLAEVLVALARNPALTAHARTHLGRRQRELSLFSSDRKRLADALADVAPPAGGDDAGDDDA